ncbi:MAG TPA: DUF3352 domain-containing protein [Solirubrobacteraceae bacterium]|nr:DUF3352 domain-containing protein [Solirubrobacteraceae bacterium]
MIAKARVLIASLLAIAALAGCGSGGPSGASPARLAPANTLFYLELTLRPQGAQHDAAESALTKVIGHSPDAAIQRGVTRLFRRAGLSYSNDIAPWLGQRIGIVLTSVSSPPNIGLIAPTNDPASALATLHRLARHASLRSATYRGLHYQIGTSNGTPLALGIVSRAAVVATPAAFTSIVDASRGRGLIASPAYRAAVRAMPAGPLVRGYADLSALRSRLRLLLSALPNTGAGTQVLPALLNRLNGAVAFSLTVRRDAFVADARSTVSHPATGSDVSGLPGQSWLALAGGTGSQRTVSLLRALRGNPAFAALLSRFRARTGLDLIRDVLPGLGKVELSVQGTSPLTLGAGLEATPTDAAAGRRLLAGIRRVASRSSSLMVSGNDRNFTISKRGSLLPRVLVTESGSKLVATFDEAVSQLRTPVLRLSDNPRFVTARRQLPAGSRVSAFLDFRSLAQLLQGLRSFTANPPSSNVLAILHRFDYLIVGSNPSSGQSRIVLALR